MWRSILILPLCISASIAAVAPAASLSGDRSMPAAADVDVTGSFRGPGIARPIPKGGGFYRVGAPYMIAGRTYVPREDPYYRAEGIASWYGDYFHGRLTANGERYDMHALSAAHPTLPLPSYVRVTNLDNNRSLIVRVNDRGPFHDGRIIDMSVRAAKLLGFYERGLARVHVEYLGPARLEGSDDARLAATLRYQRPRQPAIMSASLGEVASYEQTGSVAPSSAIIPLFEVRHDRAANSVPAEPESIDEFPRMIFD
ncbi:MAG TPA: septal ring lytic transglycosylase RlpA family protein [Xanthobacteraceae bacterium]|nr:septal ring lytic transglycosylase RlpA family protein [Xanthobacteraceae bacterium]